MSGANGALDKAAGIAGGADAGDGAGDAIAGRGVSVRSNAGAAVGDGAVVLGMIDRLLARPDVPVEKLEQLFALHQKVQADAARRAYLAAFSHLQKVMPAATRGGTGHNAKKYARFEDVIAAVRGPLSEHGFSLSFRIHQEGASVRVTGVLGHEDGHQETTDLPLPADTSGSKNAVQAWGSAISYGKRYVALTLLGIATEDDDDGKAAGSFETLTDEQAETLRTLITTTGSNVSQFLAFAKAESISDILQKDFKRLKETLEVKAKRQVRP